MGLTWAVVAMLAALIGIVFLIDLKRRRGFARSLPHDISRRDRKHALRSEQLRMAHFLETSGIRPSADRGNLGGGGQS